MLYNGRIWKLSDREEIIDDLLSNGRDFLIEKFETFEKVAQELDDAILRKFNRYLRQQDDNDVVNRIKKDIRLILYNNRKIPENTRHLLGLDESEDILENY